MEPQVPLSRQLGGELVVLGVVLPHRDPQPGGGAELHRLGGGLHPGGGLGRPAEIAGVGELLPDLQQVPLSLRQGDRLQHTVQILQLPPPLLDLLLEHHLGGLGLVVLLVVPGGVLLGSEEGVQGHLHLSPLRVVVVCQPGGPHTLLEGIEIGGDQIPQLPLPLPVLGGLPLDLLLAHPAGHPLPEALHRLLELLPPLAHLLGGGPAGVELVEQLGEALPPPGLGARAVLEDGQEGEVHRLPVPDEEIGEEAVVRLHDPAEPLQLLLQALPPALAAGAELQLPVQQGREAGLGLRQAVEHAGHHRALPGGHIPLHPADAVQDALLGVQEYQVGPAAHGLQHQGPGDPVPQLVDRLHADEDDPLQMGLLQGQDAPAGEVLAQEHAEHGGLGRVLPDLPGQVEAWPVGAGGEEELHVLPRPPDRQQDLLPAGLIDLVDLAAHQGLPQFFQYRRQADRVQCHIYRVSSLLSPRRPSSPRRAR